MEILLQKSKVKFTKHGRNYIKIIKNRTLKENSIYFMDSINNGHFVIISTFFHVQLSDYKDEEERYYFKDLLFEKTTIKIDKVVKDIVAKQKDNINLYFKSTDNKISEDDHKNKISDFIIKHSKKIGKLLENYCYLCSFSENEKLEIELIHLKFEFKRQYRDEEIRNIIYNYVENFLIDKVKNLRFTKDLKQKFKWTPDIHIKILNELDNLEQKYNTKIRISVDHTDKNNGKDEISKIVYNQLLNNDIKLFKNSDIELPINFKIRIMNIKRQFVYSQLSKLDINDFNFKDGNKTYTLFIFLKSKKDEEENKSESIIGCTVKGEELDIKDFIKYKLIEIKHFYIPYVFNILKQWKIEGKYLQKLNRKLDELECIEINRFLNKNKINKFTFTFDEYDFHLSKDEDNNLLSDKDDAYNILRYKRDANSKPLINIKINITKLTTKCVKSDGK